MCYVGLHVNFCINWRKSIVFVFDCSLLKFDTLVVVPFVCFCLLLFLVVAKYLLVTFSMFFSLFG